MSDCCSSEKPSAAPPCCPAGRFDWLFWTGVIVIAGAYLTHWTLHTQAESVPFLGTFAHAVFEFMNKMWWGILLGIAAIGLLTAIPREFVIAILGKGGGLTGLLRATAAGLLLDLCNHGILMVGMKLYERGASLGQVFAFLIASPWNSFTLTFILLSLIGWQWTLTIIVLSAVIAIITGFLTDRLVQAGRLPANPHQKDLPADFRFRAEAKSRWKATTVDRAFLVGTLRTAVVESRMIIRWIFFGTILAAALRAAVDPSTFSDWFGPSVAGLLLTFAAATLIEVCSEGSSPLAADLVNRGGAPGNGFAFLMAGAATDVTEIMALRQTCRSWRIALALPLLTSPQVLLVAYFLNNLGGG
jgi:uncharacterized membrane protein YraQ (UPF0718 family)